MMFLQPKRGNAPSHKRLFTEAWRDSTHSEDEREMSGPLRPVFVGVLLLTVFYIIRTYGPVQTSPREGDTFNRAAAASNGSQSLVADTEFSPFWLTSEEESRTDYAVWRLNASIRWRQTHSWAYTCGVFVDQRVRPTLVRFLLLAPTEQLVPSYGRNGTNYGKYECIFLRRDVTPVRGTFLVETRGRHPDEAHVPVYRNGSARVELCVGDDPRTNCSYLWSTEVVAKSAASVPVGGLTSAPYEPVLVTCAVPEDASARLVSLVYRREESAFWFAPRKLHFGVRKQRASVGVCVPPWISEDGVGAQRDLLEYLAYYAALGARHFNVYVNATDQRTLAFLLALRKRSPVSLTYRSWPGVSAGSSLAFAEAALVMDCAYSYADTPIEYVTTVALREFVVLRKASSFGDFLSKAAFANATSLTLLSQPFTTEGSLGMDDMLLAQRDRLRVRPLLDPPGRTSRVFLKATRIVEADAAQVYHALQPNPITVDSEEAIVLRYVTAPNDVTGRGEGVAYVDFSNYTNEDSSLAKWQAKMSSLSPLLWFRRNPRKKKDWRLIRDGTPL
ncbi:uncharacterized protein [Dermacentor andersoni]|uniref:uncharacterized protein isoform X1 n=1 Tax=Dermacentor andersoni TaxID=34620 RepID=UPI0021551043|nr:uncharacterized protein LOC126539043 isoform X1 [Dermacentor andersoni]